MECWSRATEAVEQPNLLENDPEKIPQRIGSQRITSIHFKITTRTSSHCFVPGCNNSDRLSVPYYLRKHILKADHMFIAQQSRVCEEHKMN